MAAITKVDPILVSPVGYESAQHGYATEDLNAGELVVVAGAPPDARWDISYEEADGADAIGIVLKSCKAGGTVDVAYEGEMDGFSGLTAGNLLSIVNGAIDSAAPTHAVTGTETGGDVTGTATLLPYTIRAVTETRIRFRFG